MNVIKIEFNDEKKFLLKVIKFQNFKIIFFVGIYIGKIILFTILVNKK